MAFVIDDEFPLVVEHLKKSAPDRYGRVHGSI
jgi:hypothetical protein